MRSAVGSHTGRMGVRARVEARRGRWALPGVVSVAAAVLVLGLPPAGAAGSLAAARAALAGRGPVVVSVLGDSTGNEDGEWVDLWARSLGSKRRVVLHQWDDDHGGWQPRVRTYGTRGPAVTIWNGSKSGAAAGYAHARLQVLEPDRPDLVVYSFGHNHSPGKAVGPMRSLVDAVEARWRGTPSEVVILQNPELGARAAKHARVEAELRAWAARAGLPTIDVFGAYQSRADEPLLLKDFHHPNAAGSAVWATVVEEALGPSRAE